MKKLKNRLRKMIVMLCTVAAFLCCSLVPVLADEEATTETIDENSDLDAGVVNGDELPFYPTDIYGKNYILLTYPIYTNDVYDAYFLYIFDCDVSVSMVYPYSDNDKSIHLLINDVTNVSSYRYFEYTPDEGWVCQGSGSNEIRVTPGNGPTILKSTVDIFLTSDNSLQYAKNADIIERPLDSLSVFLYDFGCLLTGSIGVVSTSIVGVVGSFFIIIPAIVGLFYALLRRD